MPRFTSQGWWCYCNQKNSPDSRKCCKCGASKVQRNAQVGASERAVVYHNPLTGEHKTPARADAPMPQAYSNQGFERREIMNMSAYEKETGTVHEATNFNNGNEPVPENYTVPHISKKAKEDLIDDMRQAIASGPWTGGV